MSHLASNETVASVPPSDATAKVNTDSKQSQHLLSTETAPVFLYPLAIPLGGVTALMMAAAGRLDGGVAAGGVGPRRHGSDRHRDNDRVHTGNQSGHTSNQSGHNSHSS